MLLLSGNDRRPIPDLRARDGQALRRLTIRLYICRVIAVKTVRISRETLLVLERFVTRPSDWRYGYELSRNTGLKSGTLYPILMRLERYKLLEARWVVTEDGVPPRHTYRLTASGLELARAKLAEALPARLLQQPRLSRGWE
ncbi:MAG: PadR family transcriptional regulator [Terriglobia bacterium]